MVKSITCLLAGLFMMSGCSDNPAIHHDPLSEDEIPVTFSFSLQQEVSPFRSTRNMPGNLPPEPTTQSIKEEEEERPDAMPFTYLEYAVYDLDSEEEIKHIQFNLKQMPTLKVSDDFKPGSYLVCFLAHSVDGVTYSAEDKLISFPEVGDSFWEAQELELADLDPEQAIRVTLNRVIASVEFVPSDQQLPEPNSTFTLTADQQYSSFHLLKGTAGETSNPFKSSYTFTGAEELSNLRHGFYTFVPTAAPKGQASVGEVTLTTHTADEEMLRSRRISEVPIYQNQVTRYTGILYTKGLTDLGFQVEINNQWEKENEFELEEE